MALVSAPRDQLLVEWRSTGQSRLVFERLQPAQVNCRVLGVYFYFSPHHSKFFACDKFNGLKGSRKQYTQLLLDVLQLLQEKGCGNAVSFGNQRKWNSGFVGGGVVAEGKLTACSYIFCQMKQVSTNL